MNICCTFPGKYGDLLWALPTIRAISRRAGAPVDLLIPYSFASIVPLLLQQEYLGDIHAETEWQVQDTAPISPRVPPASENFAEFDAVIHLGYRDWPLPDVARHTWETATLAWRDTLGEDAMLEELDLSTPWITIPVAYPRWEDVVVGFTDEYFELKYGLYKLLQRSVQTPQLLASIVSIAGMPGSRWNVEAGHACENLEVAARVLASARVFLGDCSALHVLAVAMGVPVVLMEPQTMRHNPVFYPLGTAGPEVTLVLGSDGHPTFDARHVRDALRTALARRPKVQRTR